MLKSQRKINIFLFYLVALMLMIFATCSQAASYDEKDVTQKVVVKPQSTLKLWNRTREEAGQATLAAKQLAQLSWTELGAQLNCSPTWLASVVMGQSSMDADRATKLEQILRLPSGAGTAFTWPPLKSQFDSTTLFQDPLIYRFHEVALVYGTSIKAMIHELFGDGIMSAIDFTVDVTRDGDRVHVLLNGKFLAYRRW